MENNDRKKMIQQGFDTADVSVHHEPLGYQMTDAQLWWVVVWNAGWRGLLNQLTGEEQREFEIGHREEIKNLLGEEGVWFGVGVLVGVGVR
ncbi:MAG: hypothetical protein OEY06_08795 [Gammaproteobacteria bacterium]|nr:hypothetical protein [Gammaproteobacteria bacterium]